MEFTLDRATEILRRTPATLDALLRPLSDVWIFSNEGEGSWSPHDIIGHLIIAEEHNWIPRAKIILEYGETRAFERFDRLAMIERFKGRPIGDLLDIFTELRAGSLMELEMLNPTPEMLEKRGSQPELGAVTLGQLLSTWMVHDLAHLGQIARVMAKQYREEVGPWRAYLPILSR